MAHIEVGDTQAWTDNTKLTINELEDELIEQVESMVLGQIGRAYDISTWVTPLTTPTLVRKIIAMIYVADIYDRTYSEDGEVSSPWSAYLREQAMILIAGIVDATIVLIDLPAEQTPPSSSASFYPTDASSSATPTADDPSLGGPAFSMGTLW